MTEFWLIHFDYGFNIIKQKKISGFPGRSLVETRPKVLSDGNLLIHGFVNDSLNHSDMFFYKMTLDGDSILSVLIEMPGMQFTHDRIERKNNQGFYSFTMGELPMDPQGTEGMLSFDTTFNLISIDSVPRNIYDMMNAKWVSNIAYLITGKKRCDNPFHLNMGILKLDTLNEVLNENYFGFQADTNTYPG